MTLGSFSTFTHSKPKTSFCIYKTCYVSKNMGSSGAYKGLTFGVAFPSDALGVDADEIIGILVIYSFLSFI